MTQMRAMTSPFLQPAQALTTYGFATGVRVHYFPMQSVDMAREEFGADLESAQAFVQATTCNDCGIEGSAGHECRDCGIPVCGCYRDDHRDDVYWCGDCVTVHACGCAACTD